MTPAEQVVLRTLLDEYLHAERTATCGFGPYGRTAERVGLSASRVGMVEFECAGYCDASLDAGEYVSAAIQRLCDLLHTTPERFLLERTV